MNLLYFLRVVIISFEFTILIGMAGVLTFMGNTVGNVSVTLDVNSELMNWAVLLPISLFVWCANECRAIVIEDKESGRVLVNWPDYWKLKQHIIVALLYALVFCGISTYPWLGKVGIGSSSSLVHFLAGTLGIICVAAHLYFAKLAISEILLKD
jgi:hypothetical protein